jgi:hypothetical protein
MNEGRQNTQNRQAHCTLRISNWLWLSIQPIETGEDEVVEVKCHTGYQAWHRSLGVVLATQINSFWVHKASFIPYMLCHGFNLHWWRAKPKSRGEEPVHPQGAQESSVAAGTSAADTTTATLHMLMQILCRWLSSKGSGLQRWRRNLSGDEKARI